MPNNVLSGALLLFWASLIQAYSSSVITSSCTLVAAWFDGPVHGAPYSVTNTATSYTTTLFSTTTGIATVTASTTSTVITGTSTVQSPIATVTVTVYGNIAASAQGAQGSHITSGTTSTSTIVTQVATTTGSRAQKRDLEKRFNFQQTSCQVSMKYMTSSTSTIPSSTFTVRPTVMTAATTTVLQGTSTLTITKPPISTTTASTKATGLQSTIIDGNIYYLVPGCIAN